MVLNIFIHSTKETKYIKIEFLLRALRSFVNLNNQKISFVLELRDFAYWQKLCSLPRP